MKGWTSRKRRNGKGKIKGRPEVFMVEVNIYLFLEEVYIQHILQSDIQKEGLHIYVYICHVTRHLMWVT